MEDYRIPNFQICTITSHWRHIRMYWSHKGRLRTKRKRFLCRSDSMFIWVWENLLFRVCPGIYMRKYGFHSNCCVGWSRYTRKGGIMGRSSLRMFLWLQWTGYFWLNRIRRRLFTTMSTKLKNLTNGAIWPPSNSCRWKIWSNIKIKAILLSVWPSSKN